MQKRRRALRVPIWSRPDRALTPRQRAQKARFLHALSLARRGKETLEENLSAQGINLEQVPKKTDALKKVRGKLLPRTRDQIPRSLKFYEKGKLVHAEIANSEAASDIGRYWNAIGKLTGDREVQGTSYSSETTIQGIGWHASTHWRRILRSSLNSKRVDLSRDLRNL